MKFKKHIRWVNGAWLFLFVATLSGVLMMSQVVPARADDRQNATQLVDKACMTLSNFMADKNMGAFRDFMKNAKAVVIAPSLLKGAFIVGVSGGNAVAMIREPNGQWSNPAFYTIGGASFGLQIGGQSSEVILLAMTDRGMNALMSNSLKLGVGAGIAAGPVGVGAQAASANISADILSFSRSKGLYGGVSLDGAVVAVRASLNDAYYNQKVSPTDIFIRGNVKNPQAACLTQNLLKSAEGNMRGELASAN
jgi:lipid-binding SYLF domain-containing protein